MSLNYELLYDTVRLGHGEVDATVLRDSQASPISWGQLTAPDPGPIRIAGDTDRLSGMVYPVNNLGWPILAQNVWKALGAQGTPFPVVTIGEDGEEALPGYFLGVHVPVLSDLMDLKQSRFEPDSLFPDQPGYIERLVLRTSSNVPLFRLSQCTGRLFVSREARLALLDMPTSGMQFVPV